MFDKEMQKALEEDGEKLRQLTGEEHGPIFLSLSEEDFEDDLDAILDAVLGPKE